MALQIRKYPNRAADVKKWAEDLTPAQLAFLVQITFAASQGDYTVFGEIFQWCANRWDDMDDKARDEAAHEGTERWFTEAALIRFHEDVKNAQDALAQAQNSGIINPQTGRPFGT